MPVNIEWYEIALRLALTVGAGAAIGFNRMERGRPAGLRTCTLVCLAASLAMIQANLLMPTNGKPHDSYVVFDLMRLPLGILTGMGFIGAGAILRRGDMVQGVTTAATLWVVTMIGLCLGGGQIGLGLAGLAIALVVLTALKRLDRTSRQDRHAMLVVQANSDGPSEDDVRANVRAAGFGIGTWDVAYKTVRGTTRCMMRSRVLWNGRPDDIDTPMFVNRLREMPGVKLVRWSA